MSRACSENVPTGPRKATVAPSAMGVDGVGAAAVVTIGEDNDMDEAALRGLVDGIGSGAVSADDAVAQLRRLPFVDLGFARVDHHRQLRQGMAETVYAPGKSPEQCAAIVGELLAQPGSSPVLLSRADEAQRDAALAANAAAHVVEAGGGDPGDRALHTLVWRPAPARPERVAVVSAGTADLPVADEAAVTLWAHGLDALRITDIGVAGLHRVLDAVDELVACDALVVVAGMEGALASVVGRAHPRAGRGRAHQRRVRRRPGRGHRPSRHAGVLRVGPHRGRHRQRLRRRLRRAAGARPGAGRRDPHRRRSGYGRRSRPPWLTMRTVMTMCTRTWPRRMGPAAGVGWRDRALR